jgi:hypothetical protein
MNRATQIRTKRQLVTLAVSHRVLSDHVAVLADAIDEALARYRTGRRTASSGVRLDGWYVAQRMAEVLESVMNTELEAKP